MPDCAGARAAWASALRQVDSLCDERATARLREGLFAVFSSLLRCAQKSDKRKKEAPLEYFGSFLHVLSLVRQEAEEARDKAKERAMQKVEQLLMLWPKCRDQFPASVATALPVNANRSVVKNTLYKYVVDCIVALEHESVDSARQIYDGDQAWRDAICSSTKLMSAYCRVVEDSAWGVMVEEVPLICDLFRVPVVVTSTDGEELQRFDATEMNSIFDERREFEAFPQNQVRKKTYPFFFFTHFVFVFFFEGSLADFKKE